MVPEIRQGRQKKTTKATHDQTYENEKKAYIIVWPIKEKTSYIESKEKMMGLGVSLRL